MIQPLLSCDPPLSGLDIELLESEVRQINAMSLKIFDDGEVKHNDRRTADRTADRIRKLAINAIRAVAEVQQHSDAVAPVAFDALPKAELHEVLQRRETLEDFNRLVTHVLKVLFANPAERPVQLTPDWTLKSSDVVAYPDLVALMDPQELSESMAIAGGNLSRPGRAAVR